MVRIAGLVIAFCLLAFSYFWSSTPEENRSSMPEPVRIAADATADSMAVVGRALDECCGPFVRKAWNRFQTQVDEFEKRNEKKANPNAVIAMNLDLTASDYSFQHMQDAAFTKSTLIGAKFVKTYLAGAALDSVNASGSDFNQAIITNASARGADFSNSNFSNTDLTALTAQGAVFDKANFNTATISGSQFSGASFINATLTDSFAERSIFYASIFTRAKLENTNFKKANFDLAVFQNAVFIGGDFTKASFKETDFSGADLSQVTLLSQEQLGTACGDEQTLLPAGFTLQTCAQMRAAKAAAEASFVAENADPAQ